MRKRAFFLSLLFIHAFGTARPAQEDPVAAIRALYTRTQEAIKLALQAEKEGGDAGLYATELVVNSHKGPWRAVGNYSRAVTFWFADQPEFAAAEGRSPESVLVKVDVRTVAAARMETEEFLFDDGKPVFYFRRAPSGGEKPLETRYYWKGGQLVRSVSDPAAIEPIEAPDAPAAARRAASLMKIFLATFE